MGFLDKNNYSMIVNSVKCDSVLNSLTFFHVTEGLPPDAMNDLLEGVVKYELGLPAVP